MNSWLGIDASTQSVSALLVDDRGHTLAEESVNFGQDLPQYGAPKGFIEGKIEGEVFSDPLMWLDALDLCFSRMVSSGVDFSEVRGISGAGQQHGTVYLNNRWTECLSSLGKSNSLVECFSPSLSRTLSPIWMDISTAQECEEIARALGGGIEVCQRSGSIPTERFSGPQIRKFFKLYRKAYENTFRIHLVSSFFSSVLTGKDSPIDHGDGAGMNLLNLKSLDWDADLLKATAPDLIHKLPPAFPSDSILGTVSPYFCKQYGFAKSAEVVVFTGDNPSSLIGMGAGQSTRAVISLGTSDTFFAAMDEPKTDPNGYGHVFGNPLGGYMSLVCFRNGSFAREKIKELLGVDWTAFGLEEMEKTPPGNNGNGMIPFFGPEISPRVNQQEPIQFGSKAFRESPTAPELVRACLEGQFLNMRLQTKWIGIPLQSILLTGGASANDGIAQTLADILQAPVDRLVSTGSVAIGGVLRSAIRLGGGVDDMQKNLCAPAPGSRRSPRSETCNAYNELTDKFRENLSRVLSKQSRTVL